MELRNFFKKKEIKDTTQNDRDFEKKNNKFLKVFGCVALATFMTATALFATAPFGTSTASAAAATNLSNTSQSTSIITPQEDDPVLFTTEEGIEIKYGKTTLESGNLEGFPYFQSETSTKTYTWVVIGENASNTKKEVPTSAHAYMRDSGEIDNPAYNAILNDENILKSQFFDTYTNTLVTNEEIPENCILCLANDIVETGAYNNIPLNNGNYVYQTFRGIENIAIRMASYYTDTSDILGLKMLTDRIQEVTLSTYTMMYASYAWVTDTCSAYIFPLASHSSSTFYYARYLTADQIKLSQNQWLRGNNGSQGGTGTGGYSYGWSSYLTTTGTHASAAVYTSLGYRPAFVLKMG